MTSGDKLAPLSLLLVDEDAAAYTLVRDLLAELDPELRDGRAYEVTWQRDHEAALAALCKGRHHVCLLDDGGPTRPGLALLERAVAAGCHVPIVVLNGRDSGEIEARSLRLGAVDYLVKQELSVESLARALRQAHARNQALESVRQRDDFLEAIFGACTDAMLVADDEGCYVDGNPAALRLLGLASR